MDVGNLAAVKIALACADCLLPLALFKRVGAAMECARIVRALRQFEKRAYAKEVVGRDLDALARIALGRKR